MSNKSKEFTQEDLDALFALDKELNNLDDLLGNALESGDVPEAIYSKVQKFFESMDTIYQNTADLLDEGQQSQLNDHINKILTSTKELETHLEHSRDKLSEQSVELVNRVIDLLSDENKSAWINALPIKNPDVVAFEGIMLENALNVAIKNQKQMSLENLSNNLKDFENSMEEGFEEGEISQAFYDDLNEFLDAMKDLSHHSRQLADKAQMSADDNILIDNILLSADQLKKEIQDTHPNPAEVKMLNSAIELLTDESKNTWIKELPIEDPEEIEMRGNYLKSALKDFSTELKRERGWSRAEADTTKSRAEIQTTSRKASLPESMKKLAETVKTNVEAEEKERQENKENKDINAPKQ